jgi:hypothetical protein
MTERTAQNLMNVFDTFKDKSEKISHLGPSALYLLAAPSTPEAVLAEAAAYRPLSQSTSRCHHDIRGAGRIPCPVGCQLSKRPVTRRRHSLRSSGMAFARATPIQVLV